MIIEEIHITETMSRTIKTAASTLLIEVYDIIFELRWFILAAFALILADLWFGIQESKRRGIEIRASSAGRRTLNKFIDYVLYIVLGTTLAMAVSSWALNPLYIASGILFFCYAFEIDSIYSHICYLHGAKKQISIFKLVWLAITFQFKEIKNIDNIKIENNKTTSTNPE